MNVWKISLKNIKSKPLYTFLSVFILSLSIALLLGIQQLKTSFKHQMNNNLGDIDLVVGAKGSPLQLVLASILHIDNPTGNISYEDAKKISKSRLIKTAVPISYGDNYKGYRIVGTTNDFLSFYQAELAIGKQVKKSSEVILGHSVAERLSLKIGDTFLSSHGLVENDIDVHNNELKIVGILKPTQKVIDRLIITNLESIWDAHNHEEKIKKDDEHNHKHDDENKQITSLLLTLKNPSALLSLPRRINERTNMQAALPRFELDRLYEFTGIGFKTISWIAYLILVISGITIFISLYKMVKERAFDLAILRTYGANNLQLIKMVAYEGLTIIIIAFLLGYIFVKIGLYSIFKVVETDYKQSILQELPFQEVLQIAMLVFTMVIFAILLAIYPITKMKISTILSNEK